ncbi:MAG: DUF2188 domain-containing protein [Gemmatimonadota bacterium]
MSTTRKTRTGQRRPNVWVVRHEDAFAVEFEKGRPIVAGLTQLAAVRIARVITQEFGSELVVQNRQGQIRCRDSHGNDPFPPKG